MIPTKYTKMIFIKYCFIFLVAFAQLTSTVKVNMQGSLTLGKEVLDTLSHYLQTNFQNNRANRRSGAEGGIAALASMINPIDPNTDRIKWTVDSQGFCKDVLFCEEQPKMTFIVDYITLLGNAVENIFDSVMSPAQVKGTTDTIGIIFGQKLRRILHEVHKVLKYADKRADEEAEKAKVSHQWAGVLKRIAAKFQEQALILVFEQLPGDEKDVHNVRKKLIQKIIIAIAIVENNYEGRLCTELKMCIHDHAITKSLYRFLDYFKEATDERAREFIKYFYESLPEDFFYFTDEDTGHEFQIVLSEMSFTATVPTKQILISVLKTVEARKTYIKTGNDTIMKGYDSQMANLILSDMDHFYFNTAKRKRYPFEDFMDIFSGWLRTGGRLSKHVRKVIKEIKQKLMTEPKDLVNKLGNQIRVFLELTVDPEDGRY